MKVVYCTISGDVPILINENFDKFFEDANVEPVKGWFAEVKIKNSPSKFLMFREDHSEDYMIESTLALHYGTKKFPSNPKLAYNHALKILIKEDAKDAFDVVKQAYEIIFKEECPYRFEDINE